MLFLGNNVAKAAALNFIREHWSPVCGTCCHNYDPRDHGGVQIG